MSQPTDHGMEVVRSDNGPHPHFNTDHYGMQQGEGKEVVVLAADAAGAGEKILLMEEHTAPLPPQSKPSRRRLWIGAAAVVLVLIIVGAVVGGVVGSKKSSSSSSAGPSPSPSSTASPSTMLRDKSALAATGWRLGGTSNMRVFWQAKNSSIYYSAWDTSHNSWDKPVRVAVDNANDTALAAGVVFQTGSQDGAPADPQVQFFYQNTTGYLEGENFRSSFTNGLADSINTGSSAYPMKAASRLSTYWPVIAYSSPELQLVMYAFGTGYGPLVKPSEGDTVAGSENVPLAVLPLQVAPPPANETTGADVKLIYRGSNGSLLEYDQYLNGTTTRNSTIDGFTISENAPLAAFATAADDSTLISYIVFQAPDGSIQYGSSTGGGSWGKPKKDAVFDGANAGTDIACVTAAADASWNISLTTATDLNRCFFQRGGRLVEVAFDGQKWTLVGNVSIP